MNYCTDHCESHENVWRLPSLECYLGSLCGKLSVWPSLVDKLEFLTETETRCPQGICTGWGRGEREEFKMCDWRIYCHISYIPLPEAAGLWGSFPGWLLLGTATKKVSLEARQQVRAAEAGVKHSQEHQGTICTALCRTVMEQAINLTKRYITNERKLLSLKMQRR